MYISLLLKIINGFFDQQKLWTVPLMSPLTISVHAEAMKYQLYKVEVIELITSLYLLFFQNENLKKKKILLQSDYKKVNNTKK